MAWHLSLVFSATCSGGFFLDKKAIPVLWVSDGRDAESLKKSNSLRRATEKAEKTNCLPFRIAA